MSIVDEFFELKEQTDADLLAMQVGDFYEFFDEDARTVSQRLGLKVSEKSSHGSSYPMAGVPIEEFTPYVRELVLGDGLRVAVADQYEEDGQHKREITRVVTPGTIVHGGAEDTHYLAAVVADGSSAGISFINVHDGRVLTRSTSYERLPEFLAMYDPAEVLVRSRAIGSETTTGLVDLINESLDIPLVRTLPTADIDTLTNRVTEQFGDAALDALAIDNPLAVASAGTLLTYLDETGTGVTDCVNRLQRIGEDSDFMTLDPQTRRNLELTATRSDRQGGLSLVSVLDHTVTPIGRKRLRQVLQQPLLDYDKIIDRQEDIEALVQDALRRTDIQDDIASFTSLSRIATQASNGTATPSQVARIPDVLETVQQVIRTVDNASTLTETPLADRFRGLDTETISVVQEQLRGAVGSNPADTIGEGAIARGYSDELDDVIESFETHREWFDTLAESVQETHDLTHVTVDRNQTDGFYIQVGKSEVDNVPAHFNEVKQLKNSHRYKTEKLREHERALLQLEERREALEQELFDKVLETVTRYAPLLQEADQHVAYLDVALSLAQHAVENNWTRPAVAPMGEGVTIEAGRHPVVEQTEDFVPNDTALDDGDRFGIVTGPNMAGKSTYLRQTALIVLLAQLGSFVPAADARIGIVDAIYTRVGALDEISQGRSTFMVEMAELSSILNQATDNSLVILDEVGRGTATEDGVAIAQATIEYLAERRQRTPRPLVLFATHYHELTGLSDTIDAVHNVHIAVETDGDDYRFLRKVEQGAADKSYGIRVADAAGVPDAVVSRANELLAEMRQEASSEETLQEVHEALEAIDTDDQQATEEIQAVLALIEEDA